MDILETIKFILTLVTPYIKNLIESKVVPTLKRKAYEKVNDKVDNLVKDLAQNAQKIKTEENEVKKLAYIEGTKLGIDTIKAIAEKLIKASEEIEKAIQ